MKESRAETHRSAETRRQPFQTMPAPAIAFPGQEAQAGHTDHLEAAAQECYKCPRGVPWCSTGHGSTLPRLCPLLHQPEHTQHCPCLPSQTTCSVFTLLSLRNGAASPVQRAPSDLLLPSTLPAAQPLLCRLGCTPSCPQQGDPREGQDPRGGGTEQGATEPHCEGRGWRGKHSAPGCTGPARGSRCSGSHRAAPRCQCSRWDWDRAAERGTPGAAAYQ